MSISKIFHTLIGDKTLIFQRAELHQDYGIFWARLKSSYKQCPCCNSRHVRIKETKERTFRMLNLGNMRTHLKVNISKIWCLKCNSKCWVKPNFATGKFPMTNSFIFYVLQLAVMTSLLNVALFLGLKWRTVKSIDKMNLSKHAKLFSYKKLRYISIDEIAIKRGHKYMTIFTDISTGMIIHAVEGRTEEALRLFLKQLSKKAKRLRGICIDMSATYAKAIKMHLPHVPIIFDRFHVTKLLNDTIDKIRRSECMRCQEEGLKVIKGQRFLLLRNFVDLDDNEKTSLEKLLDVNISLAIAHSMKEQFRLFWDLESKAEAARFLAWWILQAMESGVIQLAKTGRTLLRHFEGLLNYFEHRINNGKAEGINNKIKVLKRSAYGFHDLEYFKLKLYHLHQKECELIG